ncbi:hypothetical protein H2201_004592 [Coniosporium apollinis]|uniref:BRCT domain-containing protein n=1 Tax=Coniosporium apollinis TaxID=61459 RepID=A0ABQ9NSD1_9PEZI|nr:hypothetical protein H2201_004592 [Coniosporium apollinis]
MESQVVQETPALESRHTERLQGVPTSNDSLLVGDEESDTEDTEHENAREESGVTRSSLDRDRSVPRGTVDSRLREASKSGQKGVGVSDERITAQTVGSNEIEEHSPTPRADSEVPLPADDHMSDDDNDTTPGESYSTAQNHVVRGTSAGTVGTTSDGASDERDDHDDEDSDIPYRKRAKRDKVESQDSLRSIVAVEIPRRRAPASHVTPKPQGRKLSNISEVSGLATTKAVQRTPSSTVSSTAPNVPPTAGRYSGPPPRVVFSNTKLPEMPGYMKSFEKQGGTRVNSVTETGCNFLCVGTGKLVKTGKLLLSIAYGKQIVTDSWIKQSSQAGHLLDPQSFLPADTEREKEWGFRMSDAVGIDRRHLFAGKRLYVTPSLKKYYGKKDNGSGYKEMEEVARVAGADRMVSMPARDLRRNDNTIIFALENGDLDGSKLNEDGNRCYHMDLLSISILRGRLDLESDEFLITPSSSQPKKTPKRKRSS